MLESVKTDTVPCVPAASLFFTTPWQSLRYLLESNTENIAVSVWFEPVMV